MKDLLVFLSVLAVMTYGFRLMKRLDSFLEAVKQQEDEDSESQVH